MIDILLKELISKNIRFERSDVCIIDNKKMSVDNAIKLKKRTVKSDQKLLKSLWAQVSKVLKEYSPEQDKYNSDLNNLFVYSINSLYTDSLKHEFLKTENISDSLFEFLQKDILCYSEQIMERVIEYKISIDWVEHLIRSNLYVIALLNKYKLHIKNNVVTARGVSGPWSNLDLPMEERVFKWDDIAEETAGRERDKKRQSRYTMGLENYGDGDFSPNEGFFWRELRNEPYLFEDSDEESSYPHRNQLWV